MRVDEINYAARVREVVDGNFLPTDVQLFEHKKAVGIRGILPVFVAGIFARLSGGRAEAPFVLADLIFFTLTLGLFFLLFRTCGASFYPALACTWILYFFFDPGALPQPGPHFFQELFTVRLDRPLIEMERFPSPQWHAFFLFGFMALLFKGYQTQRKSLFVLAGLCTAILCYSYFYYAFFCFALLSSLLCFSLLAGKRRDFSLLLWAFIPSILAALPFLLLLQKAGETLPMKDIFERFGLYHGHFLFKRMSLYYICIALAFTALIRKKKSYDWILILSMLLGLGLLNKQFFTGSNLHPMHWHIRILHPLTIFMFCRIAIEAGKDGLAVPCKYLGRLALISLFGLTLFTYGIFVVKQNLYAELLHVPMQSRELDQHEFLAVLSRELPPESVLLTNDWNLARLIPVKTSFNVYLPHFAGTLASDAELTQRLMFASFLFGYKPSDWNEFLGQWPNQANDFRFMFGNTFMFEPHRERNEIYFHSSSLTETIASSGLLYLPPNLRQTWEQQYDALYGALDPTGTPMSERPLTPEFRLDMIVINRDSSWKILSDEVLLRRFKSKKTMGGYDIYQMS